jgi:hypothetical protein
MNGWQNLIQNPLSRSRDYDGRLDFLHVTLE